MGKEPISFNYKKNGKLPKTEGTGLSDFELIYLFHLQIIFWQIFQVSSVSSENFVDVSFLLNFISQCNVNIKMKYNLFLLKGDCFN